jgi:hypothetical protein
MRDAFGDKGKTSASYTTIHDKGKQNWGQEKGLEMRSSAIKLARSREKRPNLFVCMRANTTQATQTSAFLQRNL